MENPMSLETEVKILSGQIAELTEVLEKILDSSITTGRDPSHSEKKAPAKKAAPKKKAATKEEPTASEPDDKGEPEVTDALDYDADVKPRVLEVAKIKDLGDDGDSGRDVVVGALARFGCKKATELGEDKYTEFLETLEKGVVGGVGAL
jgi:hypothetical protein